MKTHTVDATSARRAKKKKKQNASKNPALSLTPEPYGLPHLFLLYHLEPVRVLFGIGQRGVGLGGGHPRSRRGALPFGHALTPRAGSSPCWVDLSQTWVTGRCACGDSSAPMHATARRPRWLAPSLPAANATPRVPLPLPRAVPFCWLPQPRRPA